MTSRTRENSSNRAQPRRGSARSPLEGQKPQRGCSQGRGARHARSAAQRALILDGSPSGGYHGQNHLQRGALLYCVRFPRLPLAWSIRRAISHPTCITCWLTHVLNRLTPVFLDIDGEKISLEFSVGWADYRGGETAQHLLKRADGALYAQKETGKNQAHPFVQIDQTQ